MHANPNDIRRAAYEMRHANGNIVDLAGGYDPDIPFPDPKVSFNKPYREQMRRRFERPVSLGFIQDIRRFSRVPRQTTDAGGIDIKIKGRDDFSLPDQFMQFAELAKMSGDFETRYTPPELFRRKTASLLVRYYDGSKGNLGQKFHRDPTDPRTGISFHLFSGASAASTESAMSDRQGAKIYQPEPFEVNYFSMSCYHRMPAFPKGVKRVFAAVMIKAEAEDMKLLEKGSLLPSGRALFAMSGLARIGAIFR